MFQQTRAAADEENLVDRARDLVSQSRLLIAQSRRLVDDQHVSRTLGGPAVHYPGSDPIAA